MSSPHATKPSAKATPNVLMPIPKMSISGCISRSASAFARRGTLREPNVVLRQSALMVSPRSTFGKDTGLQARMLLTIFLLGLVYVVFIGVLFAAGAGAGIIVVVAVVLLLLQFFASDKIALATMGVKEVSPAEEPELHGIVERLCV